MAYRPAPGRGAEAITVALPAVSYRTSLMEPGDNSTAACRVLISGCSVASEAGAAGLSGAA